MRSLLLAAVLLLSGCMPVRQLASGLLRPAGADLAADVVIHRDAWGVPHVAAPTDAAVVFGAAFAQAEDRLPALERAVLAAIGRAAEVDGEAALAGDVVRRAFQVERLAREEYAREPEERRALWDAWAGGVNHYLDTHPSVHRRLLHYEGWMLFAQDRPVDVAMVVDGVPLADVVPQALGVADGAVAAAAPRGLQRFPGASAWAVAPARSGDGRTLLLSRGAVGDLVADQRWEVNLMSAEGLRFAGMVEPGAALPHAGHNARLGWAHTGSTVDAADAYLLRFDHPEDRLLYRWDGGWRRAEVWEDTVRVATSTGVETRRLRFLRSHHGPVVRLDGEGSGVAIRLAMHEEGGGLQQRLAMLRATDLDAFWVAHTAMALPGMGTVYADGDGNLLHIPAGAVPRRNAAIDWSRPVDGADPVTAWEDYHTIDELPYLYQPRSGWLAGSGGSPFDVTTAGAGPDAAGKPGYMAAEQDAARVAFARAMLDADTSLTLTGLAPAAFAAWVAPDPRLLAAFVDEWERAGALNHVRVEPLDMAVDSLRAWDGQVTPASTTATLYLLLTERIREAGEAGADLPHLAALEAVLSRLREGWGTDAVPWGEVNRLPLTPTGGAAERASLPVGGAPSWTGAAFVIDAVEVPGERGRHAVAGQLWLGITAFGPQGPETHTVLPFGQTAGPAPPQVAGQALAHAADQGTPHAADQAPLYSGGQMKPRPFSEAEVQAAAVESYRPGERRPGGTPDAGETAPQSEP